MTSEELEQAVDAILDEFEEPRAAIRALLLANSYLEAEVERLAEAVSRGFARGRVRVPIRPTGS
jgi:hypothetical protein